MSQRGRPRSRCIGAYRPARAYSGSFIALLPLRHKPSGHASTRGNMTGCLDSRRGNVPKCHRVISGCQRWYRGIVWDCRRTRLARVCCDWTGWRGVGGGGAWVFDGWDDATEGLFMMLDVRTDRRTGGLEGGIPRERLVHAPPKSRHVKSRLGLDWTADCGEVELMARQSCRTRLHPLRPHQENCSCIHVPEAPGFEDIARRPGLLSVL